MRKPPKPEFYGLPPYLGLGRYYQAYRQKDVIRATYWIDGDDYAAFYVRLEKNRCLFSESWQKKSFAHTWHENLANAFLHHMAAVRLAEHPRYQALAQRVVDGRNIHFQLAFSPTAIFYPAGFIFRLRQPLVSANRAALAKLQNDIALLGGSNSLKYQGISPGCLLKWSHATGVSVEDIEVADFTVPLIDVIAAADLMWQSGIIPHQHELRLEIVDITASAPSHSYSVLHPGIPTGELGAFAVISFADGVSNAAEAKERFIAASQSLAEQWNSALN